MGDYENTYENIWIKQKAEEFTQQQQAQLQQQQRAYSQLGLGQLGGGLGYPYPYSTSTSTDFEVHGTLGPNFKKLIQDLIRETIQDMVDKSDGVSIPIDELRREFL